MYFHNGHAYEGEWKNGLCNGQGTLRMNYGHYYTGGWELGVKHGNGTDYFANGDRYESTWVKGTRVSVNFIAALSDDPLL